MPPKERRGQEVGQPTHVWVEASACPRISPPSLFIPAVAGLSAPELSPAGWLVPGPCDSLAADGSGDYSGDGDGGGAGWSSGGAACLPRMRSPAEANGSCLPADQSSASQVPL